MKINITESVYTALEAGNLMLRHITKDAFNVRSVELVERGGPEATVGTVRVIDLKYRLYVGDGIFSGAKTTATGRVTLKKENYIWVADSKENFIHLKLTNMRTDFKWSPDFKPIEMHPKKGTK